MTEFKSVKPYKAMLGDDILFKWNGSVFVWNEPARTGQEAVLVDEIKRPIEVTVLKLQRDSDSQRALRAKICYGEGREGWVLYDALVEKYVL